MYKKERINKGHLEISKTPPSRQTCGDGRKNENFETGQVSRETFFTITSALGDNCVEKLKQDIAYISSP